MTLTMLQGPDSGRLKMSTENDDAFVEMPFACGCIVPAVITFAFVLFLGG